MTHLTGHDRSQLFLLPEAVDDYVGPDNPVRFIDAFVDGLDLAAASFSGVEPKVMGRPGYAPADLLKLYIYGYLNRVRSSRRLEAETHRNIEVIWLLRHLKPDFKTIADFRRDNRNAFRHVFRQFVLLCRQLDLFGRELLAVDGTRIKAVNNKDRNFTRASLTQFINAPGQSRAARGWLGWLQTDLAKAARVSVRTVAAFERGEITPLPNNLSAMQRAFEKSGLRLLFDREGAAAGVARQAADIELTPRRSE
jgi:transposase